MDEVRGELFWRKLPQKIRDGLSEEQEQAIRDAALTVSQRRHPLDLRLTIPIPGMARFYFVVLAGKEERSTARRDLEKHLRPIDRLGQVVLLGLTVAALSTAVLIGVLIRNAITSP